MPASVSKCPILWFPLLGFCQNARHNVKFLVGWICGCRSGGMNGNDRDDGVGIGTKLGVEIGARVGVRDGLSECQTLCRIYTSATAKACATNWRRKNSRAGPKRQWSHRRRPVSSALLETSSTPRSREPPSAPSDSSAGCVYGSTNRLPGAIPSPASRKSGAAFIHSFSHRSDSVKMSDIM